MKENKEYNILEIIGIVFMFILGYFFLFLNYFLRYGISLFNFLSIMDLALLFTIWYYLRTRESEDEVEK